MIFSRNAENSPRRTPKRAMHASETHRVPRDSIKTARSNTRTSGPRRLVPDSEMSTLWKCQLCPWLQMQTLRKRENPSKVTILEEPPVYRLPWVTARAPAAAATVRQLRMQLRVKGVVIRDLLHKREKQS